MKDVITSYSIHYTKLYDVIFLARMVTSMGAFIWPMLTFIMSGKMGFDDATIGILFAVTGLLFLPASILGGKLSYNFV